VATRQKLQAAVDIDGDRSTRSSARVYPEVPATTQGQELDESTISASDQFLHNIGPMGFGGKTPWQNYVAAAPGPLNIRWLWSSRLLASASAFSDAHP
jgi:hypothetical protein